MKTILAIAAGGAFDAVVRYLVMVQIAAVGGYVLVSVVLSIAALFLGMAAIRAIAA